MAALLPCEVYLAWAISKYVSPTFLFSPASENLWHGLTVPPSRA